MGEALAWIGQLADWVGRFVPRWVIIDTTMGGVKFVKGIEAVPLGPGIHWYWPVTTTMKTWWTARQSINLPAQVVTTTDGKTVAASGIVIFRIRDIEPLLADAYHPDELIRDISLGVLHDVIGQSSWDELQLAKNDGTMHRFCLRRLRRKLRPLGVHVLKVTLTDMAPCRVLKLLADDVNPTRG